MLFRSKWTDPNVIFKFKFRWRKKKEFGFSLKISLTVEIPIWYQFLEKTGLPMILISVVP